jgi:hypothetical protein
MLRRRVSLSTAVAPARAAHAETIDAFVAWGAASGRAVDPDIAALIHAVQDGDGDRGGWDRSSFFGFYSRRIGNWCTLADCDYPDEELPEALWFWLHHRDLSGRWGADDEPLHDLLKVLLCYGNIGFDGASAAGRGADPATRPVRVLRLPEHPPSSGGAPDRRRPGPRARDGAGLRPVAARVTRSG